MTYAVLPKLGLGPALLALALGGCSTADRLEPDASSLDSSSLDSSSLDAAVDDATITVIDATSSDAAVASDSSAGGALRVLFIGNSYTSYNDLPSIVRAIAATLPDSVTIEVESVLVDGATVTDHYNTTGARDRIRDGRFDVVVIQGQSTEPLRPLSGFLFSAGALTDDVAASGARLVWFVTWARRAGHADYASTDLRDPEYMTRQLESGYDSAALYGDRLGVIISAHVGIAFQIAIAEHPEIDLYLDDGSHPSAAGSVLAGCVLSQMITGATPHVPTPAPAGVSQEAAETLCAIAPRVACLRGATFCGGACVSLATDALHCGACGNECPGDLPCLDASCQCAEPEFAPCPGRVCVNLYSDVRNCGACGATCELGQTCDSRACVCQEATSIQSVELTELTSLRAGCVRGSETWQPECWAAAHAYCARSSCFDAGIGPVAPVSFAPYATVTCLTGDLRTASYPDLAALVPDCTGPEVASQQGCISAIHRFCVDAGNTSGFGPVGGDAGRLDLVCLPAATLVTATFADLAAAWSMCDGTTTRGGHACAFASSSLCSSRGHASGFGPVEIAGDSVTVACLDR